MNTSSQRGSVLVITLVFVIIIAVAASSVFELATNSYRLSMRNQLQAEARAVAESEIEYMYYRFKMVVVTGNAATAAPAALSDQGISDNTTLPSTIRNPFYEKHRTAGWRVRRSLVLDPVIVENGGPISGRIPETRKVGDYTYVIARVEVLPPEGSPFASAGASVRIGRRFMNSNTSIFQYSVFFQGDLELNPGNDVTINGDVVANGSIYMGPRAGFELRLIDQVRYLKSGFFNQDKLGNDTYSNPNAPTPPVTLVAPTFATSKDSQLATMDEPENLLGGIDAMVTSRDRPDLFGPPDLMDPEAWTEAQQATAENNVYRSLIAPPPSAAGSNEYPNGSPSTLDDNVIAVRRAYNRADIIITVDNDGVTVTKDGSPVAGAPSFTTKAVHDKRENKDVQMTEVDIGALKTWLEASGGDFNGLLYVNLKNSSSSTPAAIRLVNGSSLPRNDGKGFSVATNGGIYVQGDYNTDLITDADGSTRPVPAMLIGDAITVLSPRVYDPDTDTWSGWSDDEAALDFDGPGGENTVRRASGDMTINAGLLTGNYSSNASGSSGGAQNLVRYLEDWTGRSVTFNGSLGRLFQSAHFTAPYVGNIGVTYYQPSTRNFDYDTSMRRHRPPGSPESTDFSRGSFFTWHPE